MSTPKPSAFATRQPTADEVFLMIRDYFVRVIGYTADEFDAKVSLQSPIENLGDLAPDLDFADVFYAIEMPLPAARSIDGLLTASQTVREWCALLTPHMELPVVEPLVILGKPCRAGGAYLVVRELLAKAGADVSEVAPSTPLQDYVARWPRIFRYTVARLAPGVLPPVELRNPLLTFALLCDVLAVFWLVVAPPSAVVYLGLAVLTWVAWRPPFWSARFGDLATFRDLAVAVSGPALSSPRGPVR